MRLKVFILLACAMLVGCKDNKTNTLSETPIAFTKEAEGAIYKGDSLLVDQLNIEVADTPYERQTGLMYRESMKENQGMWFVFKEEAPRAFYMKNTLFTLDIIYADKAGKVVSIIKDADPLDESSLPSEGPAMYVLELNGGSCDKWNIEVNDSIVIR